MQTGTARHAGVVLAGLAAAITAAYAMCAWNPAHLIVLDKAAQRLQLFAGAATASAFAAVILAGIALSGWVRRRAGVGGLIGLRASAALACCGRGRSIA